VKNWLITLLFLPLLSWSQPEQGDPEPAPDEPDINWVDTSHAYATNKTQDLTQWMDDFFGDTVNDLEQAESFLRLELIDDWDAEDGHKLKARLRGKVQLPKVSRRLNLVFSGEESEHLDEEERKDESNIGLQYHVTEGKRSRVDLTMGFSSGNLRPGLRYRNEGSLSERSSYRFTERLQYEDGEGVYSTSLLDLNRAISTDSVMRWSNRFKYGQESEGWEWRSKLSMRHRLLVDDKRPIAMNYFAVVSGVSQPESFTKNYKVGVIFRRQVYRDFLYVELEPAYNFRRREHELDRDGVWSMVLRLEIALERDLRRERKED
jgi:hypothetical protein